ncbi:hypothetical protein GS501_04835 [Saccharibacter sp. 17.LH.SD]|uniref:hypothetical protein n=1 Tax=Saccharibacter sp. 17.LH.SD TaxID=2689393 RepID=UPI00136C6297|nr:hypothetical protein [Saccharibacter sp. 17.LH.SD]MXV44372.1 hypothetical protein [Saccharibacter sp. 17.LH.SD]
MVDDDHVSRDEVNEIRERIVTLETKQRYAQESIQSLSDKVSILSNQMSQGFSDISLQMRKLTNQKTMILTISGGAGGGLAVGLYSLLRNFIGG